MYERYSFSLVSNLTLIVVLWAYSQIGFSQTTFRSQHYAVNAEILANRLEHPWSIAVLPDRNLLITERPGRLIHFDYQSHRKTPVSGLPEIHAHGQGGLLGICVDHQFATNSLVYLAFSGSDTSGSGTEVMRARLSGDRLVEQKILFQAIPKSSGGRHYGGRIIQDEDGYLYITLGDRGDRPRAQLLSDHAGSLVRIHSDGRIPENNPFIHSPEAFPEIYTYGNRNIQGIAIQPGSKRIWMHEHGPQGGDELNRVIAGANYGWPVITYGANYGTGTRIGEGTSKPGMEQPVYYWTPSIAPSGMTFYSGELFPRWQGNILLGSLKFGLLVRLQLKDGLVTGEERLLNGELGRIRDIAVHPDGSVLLLTDESDGALIRLTPLQ